MKLELEQGIFNSSRLLLALNYMYMYYIELVGIGAESSSIHTVLQIYMYMYYTTCTCTLKKNKDVNIPLTLRYNCVSTNLDLLETLGLVGVAGFTHIHLIFRIVLHACIHMDTCTCCMYTSA